MVDSFDENGVTLKGGAEPKAEPEDDTVDNMASRAATVTQQLDNYINLLYTNSWS